MITKIKITWLIAALFIFPFSGCVVEDGPIGPTGPAGPAGLDGEDATVYYSEWFSPVEWSGQAGDWYFGANAPDLTAEVIDGGVILAYALLDGDLYESNSVRPLPAYAVGANWSFLIPEVGVIEFTCDKLGDNLPPSTDNFFRFIAIPGTIPALKSSKADNYSKEALLKMPYKEVCELLNIPE